MRVVMIGGTGFLGYFTCRDLVARGHDVLALGLGTPAPGTMPGGVRFETCDVETCPDEDLARVLAGADAVIHAAGADGRFRTSRRRSAGFAVTTSNRSDGSFPR